MEQSYLATSGIDVLKKLQMGYYVRWIKLVKAEHMWCKSTYLKCQK